MTGHNEFPTEVINAQEIHLGDGANDDGTTLIHFNMDRDWKLKQSGTGASTLLVLEDQQPSKNFKIQAISPSAGGSINFQPGTAASTSASVTITDSKDAATAYALEIDRDGNSASKVVGARVVVDNAGAGNVIGIDMSSFSSGECLIKVPASAITSAGTLSHQIPIDIGGTTFYLYAYTTGT